MALADDAYFDAETTADLLKLNAILKYCDSTALGAFALKRSPSVRSNYAQALSKLDRVAMVFDDDLYGENVLHTTELEASLYEDLIRKAKEIHVPDSHLPPQEPREKPQPHVDLMVECVIPEDEAANSPTAAATLGALPLARDSTDERPHTSPDPSPLRLPIPRPSLSLSTPDKMLRGIAALVPSPKPFARTPDAASSVSSFFSATSQASSASTRWHHMRRDSLMQYFRRGHNKRSSAAPASSPRSFSRSSKWREVDSIDSGDAHGPFSIQDSSVQSPPVSTRSSTSSSIDVQATFSFRERRALEQPLKSQRFIALQQRCQAEAQRFATFSDHQRSALPLIFGRNRLYMAERREADITKLQQKHEAAMEELENRHLEQELTETERLRLEKEEAASKNATALKHVNRRISFLGDEATGEQLRRLEEEVNAMEKLETRHKREIDTLIRGQKRERLNLQREQEKEITDFRKQMKKEFDDASKIKRNELDKNMRKLEDMIRDRKSRLTAKWYLELQIFKQETLELRDSFIGPLPLRLLALPSEFD